MRLLAALLVALAACGGGSPKPESMDPVTADEAAELAKAFEAAVEPCDGDALTALIDIDNVIRRAAKGSGLEGREQEDLYKGMKIGARDIGTTLCTDFPDDSQFTLLRIRDEGGKNPTPLFRSLSESGVNYFELELGKSKKDKQVRVIDMYIYLSGERLSDSFAELARASVSALKSGNDMSEMQEMVQARRMGDIEEARRLLAKLPKKVRDSKQVMLMELQFLDADDPDYLTVIEKVEKAYPGDPAIDMVSIDGFFLRKDLPNVLRILKRLEKRVGGDPYIGYLRANAYLLEPTPDNLTSAETAVREAIAGMPDRWDALFGLLTVQVKQKKYPEALATLATLRDKFDVGVDHDVVAGDKDWEVFLATDEYKAFVNGP